MEGWDDGDHGSGDRALAPAIAVSMSTREQKHKSESRPLVAAQQLTAIAHDLRNLSELILNRASVGGFWVSPGQERRIRDGIDARSSEMLECVDTLEQYSPSEGVYLKVRELRRHVERREDSFDALPWIGQFQTLSDELHALLTATFVFGTAEGAKHAPVPIGRAAADETTSSPAGTETINHLPQAFVKAGASLEWVRRERPDLAPGDDDKKPYTRGQHEYISDYDCPSYPDDDRTGSRVPSWETWSRYVRQFLRVTEGPRQSPRSGRPTGASIAKAEDL